MVPTLRDLHGLDDFGRVSALEAEIWGSRQDVVPPVVFAAIVPRGGVLLGAFDEEELIGFSFSLPAISHGKLVHWSHVTGVAAAYRRVGVGLSLKLAQRDRVLALGLDRIDWTFDPLQADNAHFNLRRLGVMVEHYEVNVYGALVNPLHGGLPTDRFVAQWWIDSAAVKARADADWAPAGFDAPDALLVNPTESVDGWTMCDWTVVPPSSERRLRVAVPARFTEMLASAPEVALEWRLTTRRLFQELLSRGYRIVDFAREADGGGAYVLEQSVG
jgi:predicted GNAT superfamily acetyltransferase